MTTPALSKPPTGTCCHCNGKAIYWMSDGHALLKFCSVCASPSGWAERHGYIRR